MRLVAAALAVVVTTGLGTPAAAAERDLLAEDEAGWAAG